MELLIPGLILVALMVYASTRIKRSAARAFEAESIETDRYSIEKPDGFLNVVSPPPGLELEMYSKEFGEGDAKNHRKVRVELSVANDRRDRVVAETRQSIDVDSELNEVIGDHKYVLIDGRATVEGFDRRCFYKIGGSGTDMFVLKIAALAETNDETLRKIDLIRESFEIK